MKNPMINFNLLGKFNKNTRLGKNGKTNRYEENLSKCNSHSLQ